MKKKFKTYIVAIEKTFESNGIVFYETIAKNPKDALKEAKEAYRYDKSNIDRQLEDDVKDGGLTPLPRKVKMTSLGKASQYHSKEECKLCKKVKVT